MVLPQLERAVPPSQTQPWHALPSQRVLAALGSSWAGLDPGEARARLARFGSNQVRPAEPRTRAAIVLGQVANLPSLMLAVSAGLSLLLGEVIEAAAIAGVTVLNTAVGYRIERKNDDLLLSWNKLTAGTARVVRGGVTAEISAADLVPGDVISLRHGDTVPADGRILAADGLSCNEAALTGESEPREKQAGAVAAGAPLAERPCMVYGGTLVAAGSGRVVLTATGRATRMAEVRELVETADRARSPLETRLARLARLAAWVGLGSAGAALGLGVIHRAPIARTLRGAVPLGVAALPEGLPITATAALVRAMFRMRDRGAIVRRMSAAEALGSVTVVCADKTGTMTLNDMQVAVLATPHGVVHFGDGAAPLPSTVEDPLADPITRALVAAALSSEVTPGEDGRAQAASGTERALVDAAHRAGIDVAGLFKRFPRRRIQRRANGRHFVASEHQGPDASILTFLKGAPEQVIALCRGTPGERAAILRRNHRLASQGLRILSLAWRREESGLAGEPGFEYLGLVGLRDPVREGAREAVQGAARAGVRTIILTGDQHATGVSVARETGVEGEAIDGDTLVEGLARSDGQARALLRRVAVVSRVTPEQKLRLVRELRAAGEVVAMVGDGINDAPAIKAADIGVAIGRKSTELARGTADIVLERDDLRAILAAIAEGRVVHGNVSRAARFLLATNASEVILALAGLLVGRVTLQPLQLLWINLLTDTLPAVALALEPGEPHAGAARPSSRALLERGDWWVVLRDGLLMASLGAAAYLLGGSPSAFAALTAAQLSYALTCHPGGTPTPRFAFAVGGTLALQLASLALPPLAGLLGAVGPGVIVAFAVGLVAPLLLGPSDEIVLHPQGGVA